MTVISEACQVFHDIKVKAADLEQRLGPEAARLAALEGNPVVDALLAAAHVPPEGLQIAVDVLAGLAKIYPVPDVAQAAPEAVPETTAAA